MVLGLGVLNSSTSRLALQVPYMPERHAWHRQGFSRSRLLGVGQIGQVDLICYCRDLNNSGRIGFRCRLYFTFNGYKEPE